MTHAANPSPPAAAARLLSSPALPSSLAPPPALLSCCLRSHPPVAQFATALFPVLALAAPCSRSPERFPPKMFSLSPRSLPFCPASSKSSTSKPASLSARAPSPTDSARRFLACPGRCPSSGPPPSSARAASPRLILRPWRKTAKYGLWVIGLAGLLTVIFDFDLEPFASPRTPGGSGRMPQSVPAWQSALGQLPRPGRVTIVILAFITPWLINKNAPVLRRPIIIRCSFGSCSISFPPSATPRTNSGSPPPSPSSSPPSSPPSPFAAPSEG